MDFIFQYALCNIGCCCCSVIKSCPALCNPMDCCLLGFPVLYCLPESAQTQVCCSDNVIQLFCFLLSSFLLASVFPSIKVFSNESALRIRWPKYWSFSFSISPFSKYSELISFRIDWFENHSPKASILRWSAFFMVQLSHPHMATRKTIALTIRTFVSKVMSLLFDMLPGRLCSTELHGVRHNWSDLAHTHTW